MNSLNDCVRKECTLRLPDNGSDLRLVVFDICGTLFVENTTIALIDHLTKDKGLSVVASYYFWKFIAGAGRRLGIISPSTHMRLRIRSLRGISKNDISSGCANLVNSILTSRDDVIALLREAKEEEIPYGYASYTLNEIAEAVAQKLGGMVLCSSTLEYDDSEICTGRYSLALHEYSKTKCMPDYYMNELNHTCYVTDDGVADRSILDSVGYPLLLKNDSAQDQLWPFPGIYYYVSRYRHVSQRILHLLKFWGTYILALKMDTSAELTPILITLGMLAWLAAYDVGCRHNDKRARHEAWSGERYINNIPESFFQSNLISLAWILFGLSGLLLINTLAGIAVFVLIAVLGCTFCLHNALQPRNRIATFFLLYLLKGALIPATLAHNPIPHLYLLFSALFAMSYLPKYALLKFAPTQKQAKDFQHWLILQPIIGKNIALILLSALDSHFLIVLVWVNLLTGAEYLLDRTRSKKGNSRNE